MPPAHGSGKKAGSALRLPHERFKDIKTYIASGGATKMTRKKGGRPALPASHKRKNRVRVHFSDLEMQYLTRMAGDGEMAVGANEIADYIRSQALGGKIHSVPAINNEAWAALARSAANLNQIAHRLHLVGLGAESVIAPEIKEVQESLAAFRLQLLGEGVFPYFEDTKTYITSENNNEKETYT